uniref:PepSY-associated TM helix protein n=1 Tax=uncultured bacterium UPO46 TaxID=1776971 RepID=A0A126SY68_9BACT|nr:PepSY-associated TM helix protein [uncultured bacterium UPO46]
MKFGKRWLYLSHRWLGIVLCLFMAMWFFSGVVMMYVGYPKLTLAERLAHLPKLDFPATPDGCCISPQRALVVAREALEQPRSGKAAGMDSPLDIRLTTLGPDIYWIVSQPKHKPVAINAITGIAKATFDANHAMTVAKQFSPASHPTLIETLRQDIFTVSRALDPHRPLHRIALNDSAGTELYVSSRTGEVIRDSDRMERGWNYFGSILHWLYPLKGEFLDKWRGDVIIYTSLFGTLLSILGIWVGLLRWRFKRQYISGSRSPYRAGWMRWHHLAGLIFGAVTVTWVFSGLMSMNPWKIFSAAGPKPVASALAGITLENAQFSLTPQEALSRATIPVRELSIRLFNGHAYYVLSASNGRTQVISADNFTHQAPFELFSRDTLTQAAAALIPGYSIQRVTWLTTYDNYYYARRPHTMTGHVERRLPILRVEYNDPNQTWLHIDPYTASVFNQLDQSRRTSRWLFNFLHSWDLPIFINTRPLWDITLILLSIGGFALCISGTVIAWRRLRRTKDCQRAAHAVS